MQFLQTLMHNHLVSLLMSICSLVLQLILKKQQMTSLLQWQIAMAKTSTKQFGQILNTTLQLPVPGKHLTLIGTANTSQSLQMHFQMRENQQVSTLVCINGRISLGHLINVIILLNSQYGTHTMTTSQASMIGMIIIRL